MGNKGCSLKVGASWLMGGGGSAGASSQCRGAGKVTFCALGADCGVKRGRMEPKHILPTVPAAAGHRPEVQIIALPGQLGFETLAAESPLGSSPFLVSVEVPGPGSGAALASLGTW